MKIDASIRIVLRKGLIMKLDYSYKIRFSDGTSKNVGDLNIRELIHVMYYRKINRDEKAICMKRFDEIVYADERVNNGMD